MRDFDAVTSWVEFDELYRPLLIGYARRRGLDTADAEEIAQQCLEVVLDKIGELRHRSGFRVWLRKIVDLKVRQYFKLRRKHQQARSGVFSNVPGEDPTPSQVWENQWERTHLLYCLAELRSEFARHNFQAFQLYVVRGVPVKDISEMLGMTPNQIYVAKSRVMRRLRQTSAALAETLYGSSG